MSDQHYFPPLDGKVDCSQCEAADCWCRNKYQRNRRDFTHTSGRCPRLPDQRGFVEKAERAAYEAAFMLIHAELGVGGLHLTLTLPGQKRSRKVYQTKSGYWYLLSVEGREDPQASGHHQDQPKDGGYLRLSDYIRIPLPWWHWPNRRVCPEAGETRTYSCREPG